MAKKRKKRQLEKKNKKDAKMVIMIVLGLTLFFLVVSYFVFVRGQ